VWSIPNPTPPWEWRRSGRELRAEGESEAAVFHGNVTSHIFHQSSCRYFDCKNCVDTFTAREEAIEAGYRPCKICIP